MKINITKKQYRNLLRIFYYADWMINSDKVFKKDSRQDFLEIENILTSHAKAMGCEDMLYKGREGHEIIPDDEDAFQKDIDDYNTSAFWEELNLHLTNKLIRERYSEKELKKINEEKMFHLKCLFDDLLENEFAEHGIDRLSLPEKFVRDLWKKVDMEMEIIEKEDSQKIAKANIKTNDQT